MSTPHDKNGDQVVISNTSNTKEKKINKEKKTIDPLPVFVEWICNAFSGTHTPEEMNGLYVKLMEYAEMRAESKSPLNTRRKVVGLLEDLMDQSGGDIKVMCEMLTTAKRRCWLSVHAPKGIIQTADQQADSGRKKEWL